MGFNYGQTDVHLNYDASRQLPAATLQTWMEALSGHLPEGPIGTIVDLGCGTGRFSAALAGHFAARVYGIDPARNMLATARTTTALPSVEFIQGSAEEIPLGDSAADLIFMSMAYHHIQDKAKAAGEFKRALKARGALCIRTSTAESMDAYPWVQFFPAARQIELARVPSRAGMVDFLSGEGLSLHHHAAVRQLFAENHRQYLHKIGLRGLSSLKAISDGEFQEGLEAFADYCVEREGAGAVHEDIDLFIFHVA